MPDIVNPLLDHVYEAPRGSKFKIVALGNLFGIVMLGGGLAPEFMNQRFTSFKKAKAELDKYFRNHPRPVPRKEPRVEAVKAKLNGESLPE
jgi:hypothetical protein